MTECEACGKTFVSEQPYDKCADCTEAKAVSALRKSSIDAI
jgi:hypothetical protein